MSAAIGAALKKIAVMLLTDKKVLKTIVGTVLVIVIVIVMPFAAIIGIFNGDIEINTAELQAMIEQNLDAEEVARLQRLESTMKTIQKEMKEKGYSPLRTKEAQVLYTLSLSDRDDPNLVKKLVSCFAEDQTDAQLINAVNRRFGTHISAEDFAHVMQIMRSVYISTDTYTDPQMKNNLDLVEWGKNAALHHWGYVWGTFGTVLTESFLKAKIEQYPKEVGGKREFIEKNWLGGRTADCVGLLKGYSWLNPDTHEIEYGTNGMPDIGADEMYRSASEKGPIWTIPEIPGLAVWMKGHIGIYVGNGKVVEALGTYYGVVETELSRGRWTHWLKIPYITYLEEEEETVPNEMSE